MKSLLCFCLGALSCYTGFPQVRFNSVFETGISLPVGKAVNTTHNSSGISIGDHMDLNFGEGNLFWGMGAYIGHINTTGVSDKFKETGMQIARKFQLSPSQLVFNSSSFQSTQFLLGPVAGINCNDFNMRIWAKGGFGITDPARYSAVYREGATEQKIYVSNASDSKNGFSYDLGAGFYYLMTRNLGIQLSGSYNNTKTNQVIYNYEQEKGTLPSYQAVNNTFLKASVGLVVNIGGGQSRTGGRTYTGGRKNAREAGSGLATGRRQHQPLIVRIQEADNEEPAAIVSPRDAASGIATGRRQHQPLIIRIQEADNEEPAAIASPRDAASGIATGRRQHQPLIIRIQEADNEEPAAITSPRDGVSGMATGRRQHQPLKTTNDPSGENTMTQRDAATGLATGRRMHRPLIISIDNGYNDDQPIVIVKSREAGSGLATGRRMRMQEGDNEPGGETDNAGKADAGKAAIKNPLYQGSSSSGDNPLFEGKGINKKNTGENGAGENGAGENGAHEPGVQKTVPANRVNIKRVQNINCKGNDCDIECVFELDGEEYTIILKGGLKSRRRVEVLKSN